MTLLVKPLLRAGEYPSLIKAIADATPKTHHDARECIKAAEATRWITRDLEEIRNNARTSLSILDKIKVPLNVSLPVRWGSEA